MRYRRDVVLLARLRSVTAKPLIHELLRRHTSLVSSAVAGTTPHPRSACFPLAGGAASSPAACWPSDGVGASSQTIRLPSTVRQWPCLPALPIGTRTAWCSGHTPCGAIADSAAGLGGIGGTAI